MDMPRTRHHRAHAHKRHHVWRLLQHQRRLDRFPPVGVEKAVLTPHRGFFELAGKFHDSDLVMDRPDEQGIPLFSGTFIDHATATLRWASYEEFEAACRAGGR